MCTNLFTVSVPTEREIYEFEMDFKKSLFVAVRNLSSDDIIS